MDTDKSALFPVEIPDWLCRVNDRPIPTLRDSMAMSLRNTTERPPRQPTWYPAWVEMTESIEDAIALIELHGGTANVAIRALTDEQQAELDAYEAAWADYNTRHPIQPPKADVMEWTISGIRTEEAV